MFVLKLTDYHRVQYLVQNVPFNTFFAQAVMRNIVRGTIYADKPESPQVCLILHPYGMFLLCGRTDNSDFNAQLIDLLLHTRYPRPLWLQTYPPEWSARLQSLLADKLVKYPLGSPSQAEHEFQQLNRQSVVACTRVNFAFNRDHYLSSPKPEVPQELRILKVNRRLFQDIYGTVVPTNFWNSAEDFAKSGIGFCVTEDETVLSTCFSAFVIDNYFEIGIETGPGYRVKGYAELAARAYIDYCLVKGYEPVWSCRKENLGSYRLALKLGFVVTQELPCYALVANNHS
jgi:hypothetical protein